MELFTVFIIGMLVMYLIIRKPIEIRIHHINENKVSTQDAEDIRELEEKMFKEDPTMDDLYKKLDETISEVNNIMGGSDR